MNNDFQQDCEKILNILNRNKRLQAIFLLLLRHNDFINSRILSTEIKVSPRTIKNDINLLKEKIEDYGIILFSRPYYGYKLIIENEDLHNLLKQYFQISQPVTINNKFESRVNTILRYFLSDIKPLKIEDLQNKLYLSLNSSLVKEINQVRNILNLYKLNLTTKPYQGMNIVGLNYQKIMLTVRMYKYFNTLEHQFGIKNFEKLFSCPIRNEIRKTFSQIIIQQNVVFSDIYAERFIIYLCYFYNQQPELELPTLNFNYQQTNEYKFIRELLNSLSKKETRFHFNDEIVRFLTYIAISSTDLYRFKDCSYENYHNLLYCAEKLHELVLDTFSHYLKFNEINDDTCRKDLLKMLIPISIKILLNISGDVDLGLYNQNERQYNPILYHAVDKISTRIKQQYQYHLSIREQHFIFDIFTGMINRIQLKHKKLCIAIIALNGRLSTQQLKLNIKRYFSDYIDRIDTKMLYELEEIEKRPYDYYLCDDYGKNIAISYTPIYFTKSNMNENEYISSLNDIFYHAYQYDEILPHIESKVIDSKYRFNDFQIIQENKHYETVIIDNKQDKIKIFYCLDSNIENFEIYYFQKREYFTLYGYTKFIIININVVNNLQKLKMILNIVNKIAENNKELTPLCLSEQKSYQYFFSTHSDK